MTTKIVTPTLQAELNKANPNNIADLLRQVALGDVLAGFKRTFTGLAAAATYNLTALDASGEVTGVSNPFRRGIGVLKTLRVTAATTGASVGSYILTDIGGNTVSPATHTIAGIALISDDGTTITFPSADVTAFVIEYQPSPFTVATTVEAGDEGEP